MCESESEVAQSCLTLSDPMDCSPPGSSNQGITATANIELSLGNIDINSIEQVSDCWKQIISGLSNSPSSIVLEDQKSTLRIHVILIITILIMRTQRKYSKESHFSKSGPK